MLCLGRADTGQHPRQLARLGSAGVGGASLRRAPLDVAQPLQGAGPVAGYVPRAPAGRLSAEDLDVGAVVVDQRSEEVTQGAVCRPYRDAFREDPLLVGERGLEQSLVGGRGRLFRSRRGRVVTEQVVDGAATADERRGARYGGEEDVAATDESRGR